MTKKIPIRNSLICAASLIILSCNSNPNSSELTEKVVSLEQKQSLLLSQLTALGQKHDDQEKKLKSLESKITALETKVNTINTNLAQNTKKTPDPNKVYDIPIGDSFVMGPANAKVTITEWMDFQ